MPRTAQPTCGQDDSRGRGEELEGQTKVGFKINGFKIGS